MDGSVMEVNERTGQDLQRRSTGTLDYFTVNGVTRNFRSVTFLGSKAEYADQYPNETKLDYHQPYSFAPGMTWEQIKLLPAKGYTGVINQASKLNNLVALGKGLNKAREALLKANRPTKQVESLIDNARIRYQRLKAVEN